MIKNLYISNYAIIDALEMHFSEGLTIITGETGAGKSILLGALGLIMGKRVENKSFYDEGKKCVVEGRFDVKPYELKELFLENDLDYEDDLVIRREITPSGKSRAFVNDTPVNLKVLQLLSNRLIDLHQQFDTLDLQAQNFQLRAIDALAGNKSLLKKYSGIYRKYKEKKDRLGHLESQKDALSKEVDFKKFQLEELANSNLQPGEQESLEQEQLILSNAEEIKQIMAASFQHLSESEQSVLGQLQEISHSLNQVKQVDPRIGRLSQKYEGLIFELQDLTREFEQIAEQTEFDPQRSFEVQERLDLIYKLQNKHYVATIEELLQIQSKLEVEVSDIGDLGSTLDKLRAEIEQLEKQLWELAQKIRDRRGSVTASFGKEVQNLLKEMAMPHAILKVEMKPLESPGPNGIDEIEFLFSANKGGKLLPIKDVASGGELSRLALVIKSLVASAIPLPTLIFDEIDTGISGDVALKMGNILRKMSNEHQVVTITHSPQVASKANMHYFVYKSIKDDKTVTNVRRLTTDERIRAIAVMLSQNPPSDHAIANARELIHLE